MNRRELLGALAGSLPLTAAPTRRNLASPGLRAAYLREMLDALCTRIGPRPSGSKGFDAGIAIVERELRSALPSVVRDSLTFRRWTVTGKPYFIVGGRELETWVADNSPETPGREVNGTLRKAGQYEVVDASGRVVARAGISEFGRAIVSMHSGKDETALFNIGRQDVGLLDQAVREKTAVRAHAKVKWTDNVPSASVAGTLPGKSQEEILVVAHADTKYNTPGANDNTASLVTMLMLAHAMPPETPQRTVTFLATTGEELTFFGAKHYAETRRRAGTIGAVKFCINLDSLTYGPNLQINTTSEPLARTILEIHRDLKIGTQPRVFQRDDTMDSAPFLAAGARTVHLNSRGDDARTLPLWHRPEDTAATIRADFVENSFRVLMELISRLHGAPIA